MGWWGFDLFSGDEPLDWIGEIQSYLEKTIESTMKERVHMVPAMIFYYAEFLSKFQHRSGKLYEYTQWLEDNHTDLIDGWKSKAEREIVIKELTKEIKKRFNAEGYKKVSEYPKAKIIGQEVYHLTKKENLDKIIKEGLLPQTCYAGFFENKKGIYASTSFLGAMKWQYHCLGYKLYPEAGIVKFAIANDDEVYQDLRVDYKDDFVICNKIPPERLTTFY